MRHSRIIALAVVQIALSACEKKAPEPSLQPRLDEIGRTLVEKRCASPRNLTRKPVQNRHYPSVTDEVRTFTCNDSEIVVYKANTAPPKELPLQLRLQSPHPAMDEDLAIGIQSTLVRAKLGTPIREDDDSLVYALNEVLEDTVTFNISNGRVNTITWKWSVY